MSDELDRLITQWAARHAPELIAQAQADALELARERLRARLVDALLAAAEARLTTPDSAEPQLPQAPTDAAARGVAAVRSARVGLRRRVRPARARRPRRVSTVIRSACTGTET